MAIMHDDWKYLDIKVIHTIDENQEVVAGTRKRETRILDKLDFVRITDLCEKNKIIKTKGDRESLDNVRKLRNRLHIGGLIEIEKEYRKEDLEFCFSVAKKVKNLAVKVSLQK